ncbi:hypothetical protein MPTK1_2g25640 [Marchantia polymorpha subsp. ruderalis]
MDDSCMSYMQTSQTSTRSVCSLSLSLLYQVESQQWWPRGRIPVGSEMKRIPIFSRGLYLGEGHTQARACERGESAHGICEGWDRRKGWTTD